MFGIGHLVYCTVFGDATPVTRPGVVTEIVDENNAHVTVFSVPSIDGTGTSAASLPLRYSTGKEKDTFMTAQDWHEQDASVIDLSPLAETGGDEGAVPPAPPTTESAPEGGAAPAANG